MLSRLWNLLCSLKLTIVLTSMATVLTICGSIVMLRYPKTFGMIDEMTLGAWFTRFGHSNYVLTGWFWIVCLLLILLGLNTLCCFCDWLPKVRYRWRKGGEYLLHLSFVLILIAFIWGSLRGDRSSGHELAVGETIDLTAIAPGYQLKLVAFEPTFGPEGRPDDLRSTLTLYKDGAVAKTGIIRLNHPLTYDDLVILPASLSQQVEGFRFKRADGSLVELRLGTILRQPDNTVLRVISFFPDALVRNSRIFPGSSELKNPAFELEVIAPDTEPWRGWYVLRQPLPALLASSGFTLQPLEPLVTWSSILTINRDPGANLALLGAWGMGIGALLALISFYDKRQRGDAPDII
jgi:cytochrome c biogenesis protein